MVNSYEEVENLQKIFKTRKEASKIKVQFLCSNCKTLYKKTLWKLSKETMFCKKCLLYKSRISKYGSFENYVKHLKYKQKKTAQEKYGSVSEMYIKRNKKSKITLLSKYGVDNVSKLEEVKKKKKEASFKKYGTENVFQSEKIKEKIKQTNKKKFNYEYLSQRPEHKKMLSDKWKNMSDDEMIEILSKARKRFYYDGMYFDSSWELKVYKYFKSLNKKVERGPVVYLANGKRFFIDFQVENQLYEIKSSYIAKKQKSYFKLKYCEEHNVILITDDKFDNSLFPNLQVLNIKTFEN